MWHNSSNKSAASSNRKGPTPASSSSKGKSASSKVKAEPWETLRGWSGDHDGCDIESIDIDAWSKKQNKKKKDTTKSTQNEGWQPYLCWTSTHCSTIEDFEDFVSSSLSANLKPTPKSAPSTTKDGTSDKTIFLSRTREVNKGVQNVLKSENPDSGGTQKSIVDRTERADSDDGSSMVGRAISTAYTESECPHGPGADDTGSNESVGTWATPEEGTGKVAARPSCGVRSAPPTRPPDRTESKSRKIASANSTADGGNRSSKMRRVAIRNSAAKSTVDLKRLTLDIPSPPPPQNVRLSYTNSNPKGAEDETGNLSGSPVRRDSGESQIHSPSGDSKMNSSPADKSAVLRLMEERLKRSSASSSLGFDFPNSGSVSVGDLLSSKPRLVHRLGPVGLSSERDPNVYAALIGGISEREETISPWTQAGGSATLDSAIKNKTDSIVGQSGVTQNGFRTKDTSRSVLPSLPGTKSPGSGVSLTSPSQMDSGSNGESAMMHLKQRSPGGSVDGVPTCSTASAEEARLIKTESDTKRRNDHEGKPSRPKHRGPPGFRPLAGKTSLQRAVETAHKKMHGHHYYLFTHSANPQNPPVEWQGLPKYTSSGHPSSGHQERAGSGKSHRSDRSINNAYVWKEHLEGQIKQQRSTTAPYMSNTGATSHQQTNPHFNQSSSSTSVPLTLMPTQTHNKRKPNSSFSWENVPPRRSTFSQHTTGMATP
ncbi:uncharacterized protein LOC117297617 isoform X6 [Asterias rubens]|uniref:uncharacterized protein LOC117297617 isoform X6 n=1 Tax=Asterias rubens TaxID=7604 RepID=UPI00145549B5|nr:uncharacterized protein LOC117297617 isoform X6 [Asterias rubens]